VSVTSNRLNEILKVLTVISTIFMPLTFIAGIYGMNMPIPENQLPYMYSIFWGICLVIVGGMLAWFRRHGWI
jgi:magnesium transporter